jgi:hypothetical protein
MTLERAEIETLELNCRKDTEQHVCCNRAYREDNGHDGDQPYAVFFAAKNAGNPSTIGEDPTISSKAVRLLA